MKSLLVFLFSTSLSIPVFAIDNLDNKNSNINSRASIHKMTNVAWWGGGLGANSKKSKRNTGLSGGSGDSHWQYHSPETLPGNSPKPPPQTPHIPD